VNLIQAPVRNVGTCGSDAQGRNPSSGPTRMRVPMRSPGAEQLVVAMRPVKAGGAKGLRYPALVACQPQCGRSL
jgi:hypothetical protein